MALKNFFCLGLFACFFAGLLAGGGSAFSEEKPLTVYKGDKEGVLPEGETQAFQDDPVQRQDHCCDRAVKTGEAHEMSPWEIQALLRRTDPDSPGASPRSKKPRPGRSSGRR